MDFVEQGIASARRLYDVFLKEQPELQNDGLQGWVVYAYIEGKPTRWGGGEFPSMSVANQVALREFAPGQYIVQCVDDKKDDAPFDSVTAE